MEKYIKPCMEIVDLKDIYPRFGMREMADYDILIDKDTADDVKAVMEELGFRTNEFGIGVHDQFFKAPVINFEMHRLLFSPRLEGNYYDYYHNVKERLIAVGGCEYQFSPEDFYVYMVAHEYKHYSSGGTGLRALLDTYVFLRKQDPDMEYIAAETEKLGIAYFETANRSLAQHLFSGEELTSADQEMLLYILSSGTYGTVEDMVNNGISRKGRWGYFLTRLTLPYEVMLEHYPILNKAPVLYPFCWLRRLIHGFLFKRDRAIPQLKGALGIKLK